MSMIKKVVTEAVIEVVKPAQVKYHLELTPEELAQLMLALGATTGRCGHDLYRKLHGALKEGGAARMPTLAKNNVSGWPLMTEREIKDTVKLFA